MAMRPPRPPYPWLNPGLDGQHELNFARGAGRRQTPVYASLVRLRSDALGEEWNAQAWVDLATPHILAGELEEGLQALEQADLLGALDPALPYRMGILYRESGDLGRAAIALHRAMDAQPRSALVRLALARVYLANPDPLGILGFKFLREATELDPTLAEAWMQRGEASLAAGFWRNAFHAFRRVLELEPGNVDALRNVAVTAHRAGEPAWACRALLALGTVDRQRALELRSEIRESIRSLTCREKSSAGAGPPSDLVEEAG
jgi:tetratricopeptide (TPR) repeat protein